MVREIDELVERIDEVTRVLGDYGRMCADLAHHVDKGQSLEDAFAALDGPIQKRQVTEVLAKLERARHRVRLSVFALAEEQRTSASEVGRQLGISRQLASRLAQEARGAARTGRG